ncbi:MAG: hypothetical protein KDA67_03810 [Rhodobacteraceae bacterium]|nr:hypothetical protein [Paracoccaceae bacterium]
MLLLRQFRLLRRQLRRRFAAAPAARRIFVHIGAHKTGTTYIQQTLEANRARLPLAFEVVPRRQHQLARLARIAANVRTDQDSSAKETDLRRNAALLAQRFCRVKTLLITHEGLPGPMPGRVRFPGLYPQAKYLLPAMVSGLAAHGATVELIFYQRRFADWQASLYRYRFRDQPDRDYNPRRFARRCGLPDGWGDFICELQTVLPDIPLHVVSYEKDRATGLLGRAIYQRVGLTDTDINALRRLPAQNVSRPETRHDIQFEQ